MSKLSISEINEQIKALEAQKIEVLKNSKIEAKEKIKEILEDSGYSILDLYPNLTVKNSTSEGTKVKINGKVYKLPRKGIGKSAAKALMELNKNPNDFDRNKVLKDFPA